MSGMANWQAKISIDIDDLKKRIKVAEGEIDKFANEDRKVKLDIDTKTLENTIQKLDKMLDSIGKGTNDFKQFENLSRQLSSIAIDVNNISKAFSSMDDGKDFTNNIKSINESLFSLTNTFVSEMSGKMNSSIKEVKETLSDVGDGEELSPLLKTINNIESAIDKLSSSVKGIGLNMNIDVGSDREIEAKLQAKISNALQAYQRLFDNIKMSSAGGSIINSKFFDFNIDQYDSNMSKLQAYKKFIENMRNEAKSQFKGKDVLYNESDKKYWTQASSAMGQVTKVFNEMKAATNTNPLENLFGKTDLSGVIEQLNIIVSKLDEISVSAKGFTETFKNGLNVNASVEEIEKLTNRVKELESELAKIKTPTVATEPTKDTFPDQDVSASVESATNSIKEENNVLEQNTQKVKENTQAKEQNANVNLSKYDKRLDSYNGKIDKYKTTIDRFNDGGWTSSAYLENVRAVKNAVHEYETLLNELKGKDASLVTSEDIAQLDKYEKKIKDTIATVTNMSASEKGYNFVSGQKELDKIHKLLNENSKMSSEAKAKIKAYYAEIESGNPSMSLDKIHGEILKIYNAEVEAGRAGRTLWDTLKNSGFHQIAAQMAGMVGVYDVINLGKEGFNVVRELNTALTEMRKVSDESIQTLKDYQKESFNTADAIATTGLQMQNSIADWQRLGYSIKEANELAKNSNIYKNVGDMDISTATEHMVSSVQAWKSEFNDDAVKTSEEVMNRYNKIGNEFAISSADIGEAMETSAAALKAGGNDLNEALGIITAGNIIQQDASTTSSAMKILSLRIRGAKADLESMGESTDDLADSTSKLREEIKGLTGVDIMADEDTFKSTAEIIKEIGAVWNQLSDVSQAATLEKLAGKNRASTVAGLIENYKTIDKVIEAASNADNSALDENQKIIESIDGRIQQLSNRVQEFWYNLVDDSVVKNAVSALTTIVEGGTKLIDTFGTLPTLLTAIGAGLSFKNVGRDKMYSLSF